MFPEAFDTFLWHGDTFDLPRGCTSLAVSDATRNQAFEYDGLAFGLQFHIEASETWIQKLLDDAGPNLQTGPYVQPPGTYLPAGKGLARSRRLCYAWLDRIAALCR